MRKIFYVFVWLLVYNQVLAQSTNQPVNYMIGDESFTNVYGIRPDNKTNEILRIQTHLVYVENLLRNKNIDHLTNDQQQKRIIILDILKLYTNLQLFPTNRYFPDERRPCFIDENGNICAVGYLIAETEGMHIARKINEKHQFNYILDMHEPIIEMWATENGLTLEECAMIQPTYGMQPPTGQSNEIPASTSYVVTSGLLGGMNIAITMANMNSRMNNGNTLSFVGLISGTTQLIVGLSGLKKAQEAGGVNFTPIVNTYHTQNLISGLNIAAGTATMITSAINMYLNQKIKHKRNTFNIYTDTGLHQTVYMGFSFSRIL